MPYHKARPSTKQRKLALIKTQVIEYLKGLEKVGLQAKMLMVEMDGGDNINIKLAQTGRCVVVKRMVDENTKKALLHTLMANNVSLKIYHEIASLFPPLPRACEVWLQTYYHHYNIIMH